MRFAFLILTLVLVSGQGVGAQEPVPLPKARPAPPHDHTSGPEADASDNASVDDRRGDDRGDEEAAMPELTPLIPETPPAEDMAQVSEQAPSEEEVEVSEQDPSEDRIETPEAAASEGRADGPPLPQPKPETPVADAEKPDPDSVSAPAADKPKPPIASAPKQAKPKYDLNEARQCEAALRKYSATFEVADPIVGQGECGWPRPLRLKSLSRDVKVRGKIRVRCEVALALARWTKEVVVPSAKLHMGSKPVAIEISTSYQCRRRNNGSTGKVSEHGFANGVDLMAVHFEGGKRVAVADRRGSSEADRAFQAAMRGGACAYFTTVLGPVADANHSDHFHFDLAVRRGGYRLCQ
jgi:hypothetical protein